MSIRPQTPLNKASLSRKAGIMVISRAITIAMQMGSIMILTRVLTKEAFGLISFLLLAYASVSNIAQLGLPDSVFYFLERVRTEARKRLVWKMAHLLLGLAAVSSIILVVIAWLAPRWGFEIGGLILPIALLALLELPTLHIPNVMIAEGRVSWAAAINLVTGASQLAALALPAYIGAPIATLVYSLLAYGVFRFLLSALLFSTLSGNLQAQLPGRIMAEQLRYSIPLGISQILWGINRQIDKYVVAAFLPVAVYAEYTVGSWEIPLIPAIAYSVSTVMMPSLVTYYNEGKTGNLLELWNRSVAKVTKIVLPSALLLLIIADEFIAVFFSEKYLAAALPFRIYTLIILQRVAAYSSMHKALGNTRIITYSAVYLVLINVALSIPLVLWLGIAGPPLATLIANLFTWWYSVDKIRVTLRVPFTSVFPFPFYGRTLAVTLLAAVPVVYLKFILAWSYGPQLVVLTVTFWVAYLLLASILGIIEKNEWQRLGRAVGFYRQAGSEV